MFQLPTDPWPLNPKLLLAGLFDNDPIAGGQGSGVRDQVLRLGAGLFDNDDLIFKNF